MSLGGRTVSTVCRRKREAVKTAPGKGGWERRAKATVLMRKVRTGMKFARLGIPRTFFSPWQRIGGILPCMSLIASAVKRRRMSINQPPRHSGNYSWRPFWTLTFWLARSSVGYSQSGGVDTTFKPGFDGDVFASWVQPDGKLLVSGFFTKVGSTSRNGIARLNSNASLDSTFDPGTGAFDTNLNQHATVAAVALQSDGKVIAGGYFNRFNGVARNGIVRLNSNGSLDAAFNPVLDDIVVTLALAADGKLLLGGVFTTVNGVPRPYLARLNTDGSPDTTFDTGAGPDQSVSAVALQGDGKIVVAGSFTTFNGVNRSRIARLEPDGSLDLSFDPGAGPDSYIVSLSLQTDGKIVVGSNFTQFAGVPRIYVARLNSDGSLDGSFQPNITLIFGGVLAVQTEVDGKVLVGGEFTSVNGVSTKNLTRLNADGFRDSSFLASNPSAGRNQNPRVRGVAIQADGNVLVGGGFTQFNGVNVNYLARLIGDQGGTVEFDSANYSVNETNGSANIAVRRTGSLTGSVSVNYATSDGTATAPADYESQNGAVVFGPGETNKVFTVSVKSDPLIEGNETVNLTLGNPIGGVILGNQQTATLTIIDNTNSVANGPPVLAAIGDKNINEQTLLTFTASATDPNSDTLTYSLDPGAPAGASINPTSGVFTWTPAEADGPGSYPITVRVMDNGSPPMSDTKAFTVTVNEVNSPPEIPSIGDQSAL
ncbi:MAG: hypothetical protein E6L09_15070, partial [Verrucomicrobia bacterium]